MRTPRRVMPCRAESGWLPEALSAAPRAVASCAALARAVVLAGALLGALLAAGPEAALGQTAPRQDVGASDASPPASTGDVVSAEGKRSVSGVRPGQTFEVAAVLQVDEGWHVNAHVPLQDYLIGTALELERHSDFLLAQTRYPDPRRATFAFAEEPLAVYDGEAPIFLQMKTAESARPGSYALEGNLRVQACSDEVCLQPTTLRVTIPASVVEEGVASEALNADLFAGYDPAAAQTGGPAGNEIAAMFDERGWLLAFFGLFVVGLALNLTPCVYPMLSVTVSLFGGQQETQAKRSFGKASLYLVGIVTTYSVLGVVAAFTGRLFGSWLQSPWLLAGIGLLMLGLALSMFGAYELQMPLALRQRLGAAHGATGPLGAYLSGLVVGVFAAPCIGPPVIALLAYVGAEGDPLFGLSAFTVLGFGLGVPYLVLGTFSGLLSRLPRAGLWMVWVKKLFGVALVGAALFYLGLAVAPEKALYALPVTLVVGGLYLGFLERSHRQTRLFRRLAWGVGAAAVLAGLLGFAQLQKPGLAWQPYAEDALAEAQASGRPVLLDFYADWCIPCLELDRVTFTDERVIEAAQPFARLKVDLTHFDAPAAERLRERFDVAGVPTLVFLNAEGEEIPGTRVVGFMGPEAFQQRLGLARSKRGGASQGDAAP